MMVKAGITVVCILFTFGLYCCMVQGKKEDEVMDRLYREKREADGRKDE